MHCGGWIGLRGREVVNEAHNELRNIVSDESESSQFEAFAARRNRSQKVTVIGSFEVVPPSWTVWRLS